MQLGETIATYDIALALRGENGKFDVTSPTGELYHVTCKPNHSIANLQWAGNGTNQQPFLIRKVAEPVSSAPENNKPAAPEAAASTRTAQAPFLISTDEQELSSKEGREETPAPQSTGPDTDPIPSLDLRYIDSDPQTEVPTAWVCLSSASPLVREQLISSACTTFNELDVEIRRLHAQLDDIRYRGRKKFYQAQAMAEGA